MAFFHGIQVYEILENGNLLNAIYTNTRLFDGKSYTIDSEIAIKKQHDINDIKGVEGHYECRYMETNIKTKDISGTFCDLEISKHNGVYKFTWSKGDKVIWKGLGLMAGTTHISVSYVQV